MYSHADALELLLLQGYVTISSEIPATHPHKQAIEDVLVQTLQRLDGPWTLSIRISRQGDWWLIRAESPSFNNTIVVDPADQHPARISARLVRAMGDAGMFGPLPEDRTLEDMFDTWHQGVPRRQATG